MTTKQPPSPSDAKLESPSSKSLESAAGISREFEKQTMRLVDFRLIPLLAMVYALSLIDRGNLGVARIAGMEEDLKLDVGSRYSLVSAVFFAPYVVLELPSNIALRAIGPRIWLSSIVVAWGAVQLGEGFVPDYKALAACRVLLGALEAGFFPAMVYIMTTWYTRFELQKRLAAFFMFAVLIGGFSSILGYGLAQLAGKHGLAGWRWIFIVEGALTIFFGILVYFFVVDFPDKNTFLTQEQTKFVLQRVEDDRGDSMPDKITAPKVLKHLSDWKIWVYGLMFMTQTMPAYFVGFFGNPILLGMGFTLKNALLLGAPPYGFAFITTMFFAWIADKTRMRAATLVPQTLMTIIGLSATAYAKKAGWRYFGLFFIVAGASGSIPGILAYSANNTTSQSKRAVSCAVIIAFGGVGGIFATTVFRQQDYPKYLPGLWATMAGQFFNLVLLAIMTMYFTYKNNQVREGKVKELEGREGFLYTL